MKKVVKKKNKNYKAFGLIEAIIAIAVAGIACLVFLQIASDNWTSVMRVERGDEIAKESIRTGEKVKIIVEKHNEGSEDSEGFFPELSTAVGICSRVGGTDQDPFFINFKRAFKNDN